MSFKGDINGLRQSNGEEAKIVFDTSIGGWQRQLSAFDGSNGRQQQWWYWRMTSLFDSDGGEVVVRGW